MARLPVPGGDNGIWGFVLNEFLEVEHHPDGTHLDATSTQKGVLRLRRDFGNTASTPYVVGLQGRNVASTAPSNSNVLTWSSANNRWQPQNLPDATAGISGILRLTNDFGGSSTSPTVTGIQNRDIAVAAPTNGQVLTWNNALTQWEPQTLVGGAGGGRAPTVVIAADNSTDESKDRADFICDGTGDDATINLALAVFTPALGGRLLVCEGLYDLGGTQITVPDGVLIQGLGANNTAWRWDNGTNPGIDFQNQSSARDISFLEDPGGT